MAHFAKISDDNVVVDINVLNNQEVSITKTEEDNGLITITTIESERKGVEFLTNWSGGHTKWRQTSYNNSFRHRYAGIGYFYDAETETFIDPVTVSANIKTIISEIKNTGNLTWLPNGYSDSNVTVSLMSLPLSTGLVRSFLEQDIQTNEANLTVWRQVEIADELAAAEAAEAARLAAIAAAEEAEAARLAAIAANANANVSVTVSETSEDNANANVSVTVSETPGE
jgi:hypothetical protein